MVETSAPCLADGTKDGENVVAVYPDSVYTIARTARSNSIAIVLLTAWGADSEAIVPDEVERGRRYGGREKQSGVEV